MNVKAKKLLSLVLAFVMVMGMFPATVFATNEAGRFADVRDSDWYADAVRYVSDNGPMVGVDENHFAPGGLTTRGMVVTVLHRMEGAPSAEATGFTDVESGMWYTEAVLWAQANGIVEGFGDGTFQPNASMTREQMMAVFYRYSQHKGYDVSDTMSLGIFADSIKIQSYAEDAMAWAVAVGLIKGFPDGTIRPQADSNRAQLATVLMRFSQTLGSEADRDEDGISDAVEDFFGTSVESDDTDSDGLSDYFEIYFTDTDPTLADTDADGILDGDEDSDDDGLSNLEEQELGTVGNNSDTDGDGLTDGMEVMVLGTNPTKNDSDNDGLADDEEIILGLDPLNPMSDGMTLDSERTFAQVTDSSIMDEALQNSDNWLVPSISGEVSGVINHNIQMNDASIYAFESNRSVQSDIIDVYTEYDTPLTLSFSYDQGYTGDIVNLNIMTYAEGCLTPIDTTIDESVGTISAEIYESGTYFVLDLDEFLKGLGIDVLSSISYETEEASPAEENETLSTTETSIFAAETVATPASFGATGKADIVFVIDVTGSMSGGIDGVKNNINEFAAALVNDYNIDANFALVEYQDITYDGEGSTILHKNMSSNWFTSVESYIDEVNSLRLGDGGDWEETPIDALELARSLDWRGEATKFVVLVTDAGYKTNNSYGISDMDEMAQRLHDSGVITSVIAETDDTYAALTETTGGLAGFIYDDFSDILLQLANMVGTETNSSGEWVFLDDFQAVKLSDILEHAESNDTDNDGYSDAMELGESKTVLMLMYINALLNKHSIPTECYTGKLTLDVWEYVSNPTLLDTDYDGIPDGTKDYDGSNVAEPDEYPRRIDSFSWLDIFGKYDGNRFRGEVTNNDYTIDLSFKVDYSLFFNDLSAYNRELAKLGIIYSIGAYHSNIDINYGVDFTGDDATMMMNYGR